MTHHPLETWHNLVRTQDPSGLDALLADEVVFHSPVVHTPQCGKKLAAMYLGAALRVFFNPGFRYVREIIGPSDAMLEFETEWARCFEALRQGRPRSTGLHLL